MKKNVELFADGNRAFEIGEVSAVFQRDQPPQRHGFLLACARICCVTFKQAIGVGLAVATLSHILVITRLIPSMVLWPGFLAHFRITGLHGDDGILGSMASMVEIAINAVCTLGY